MSKAKKLKNVFTERIMIRGKRYKKTFDTLKDSLNWKDEMQREAKKLRQGLTKTLGGISFEDLCEEYLGSRVGTKETTRETYKTVIRTHLLPAFREKAVKELRKSDATKLIASLELKKKSNSTINKILVILKCIIKFGVESEYLEVSPFNGIKPLKVDNRKYDYWNELEAKEFLQKAKGHRLFNVLKFAINTGLRRGELCGLKWKNLVINQNNKELHFNEQLLPGRIRGLVKGHSTRFVPLTKNAIGVLEDIGPGEPEEYIFKAKNGLSIEPTSLSIDFRKLQKEVGMKKVIKLHALRHSFASLLTAKGVNIQKVQHLMGHKDSKVTERYSHLDQKELRDTVQIVEFSE